MTIVSPASSRMIACQTGLRAPVPRVLLSATLAGPAPSGSARTSRLCQGCSRLPATTRIRLPSATATCCDRPQAKVSHLHTNQQRLTAQTKMGPDPRTHERSQPRTGPERPPHPRLSSPEGEVAADGEGFWVLGSWTHSYTGSSAAYWSRAPGRIPASPVQRARSVRTARVSGCSAPKTCSHTGSNRVNWSRASAASPPPRSSGRGGRGLSGFLDGRGQGHALGGAAALRTGPGPRPRPAPSR